MYTVAPTSQKSENNISDIANFHLLFCRSGKQWKRHRVFDAMYLYSIADDKMLWIHEKWDHLYEMNLDITGIVNN